MASAEMVIFIPAAGSASRMGGRDKLLEPVDGLPLLRRQVLMARATGHPLRVGLAADRPERRKALRDLEDTVTLQDIDGCAEGLSAALRAAARWAGIRKAAGLMILLADMPDLETTDLTRLHQAFRSDPDRPWRATDDSGRPGHPVILPARLFPALCRLVGDDGARPVLTGMATGHVPLAGRRATTDLDTPEDWQRWQAAHPGR